MGKQQGPLVWLQVRARSSCSIFKKTSRVAFILGGTLNVSLQKEVEDEAAQFGDIVQVSFCMEMWKWEQITANNHQADFIDSYRNMSYKNLLGLAWLSSWCPQARYFLHTKVYIEILIYIPHSWLLLWRDLKFVLWKKEEASKLLPSSKK